MTTANKRYNLTGFEYAIAGATSGIITRFLCQPLDVLKIRLQLQITPLNKLEQPKYQSILQAFTVIKREEGIFSLWKGHVSGQLLSVSYGAVQFSTYEIFYKQTINFRSELYSWVDPFLDIAGGTIAGIMATIVSFPFDIIRTHLVFQGEPKKIKGALDAATQIYNKNGLNGFSKGMGAGILQSALMSGLTFCFKGIFNQCWRLLFHEINEKQPISTTGSIVTGFLTGICGKTLVYPFDVIKKRLQVQHFNEKWSYSKKMIKCNGVIQCFTITINEEGFLGLFKGMTPSLLKAGASTSIYFTVYDKVCQFFFFLKN